MLHSGTLEQRLLHRVFDGANFFGETEYLIQGEPPDAGPQAFLATQRAHSTLPVHFHLQDQFQVVVDGSGTLGPHVLQPLMVHYASREAGYGPIVAGAGGLKYLTLRAVGDVGAWYLPESRDRLRRGLPKRQLHAGPWAVAGPVALHGRAAPEVRPVVAADDQGLAAWIVRLGPDQHADEPRHAGGGGRFLVVAAGAVVLDARVLGRLACAFASADEPAVRLRAGRAGAEVLVLQFPAPAAAPGAR